MTALVHVFRLHRLAGMSILGMGQNSDMTYTRLNVIGRHHVDR